MIIISSVEGTLTEYPEPRSRFNREQQNLEIIDDDFYNAYGNKFVKAVGKSSAGNKYVKGLSKGTKTYTPPPKKQSPVVKKSTVNTKKPTVAPKQLINKKIVTTKTATAKTEEGMSIKKIAIIGGISLFVLAIVGVVIYKNMNK